MNKKHSSLACIHPNAIIGKNVTIEAFATIKSDVTIGDDCWIGPNAVIWEGARLCNNVSVYPGASVSSIPQDLKFDGEQTETHIGQDTIIRECCTISRGTSDKLKTVVGNSCLLMAYSHVAHDCIIGNRCIISNGVQVGGHVEIGEWGIVGGCSAIHQHIRIGTHSMIAGYTVARKDVPPYTKAGRHPLSYAGVNTIGLKRRGFTAAKIAEIQDIYRYIFHKGLNYTQAVQTVKTNTNSSPEQQLIVDFIEKSEHGIIRGFTLSDSSSH